MMPSRYLGIDPGRQKCGLAVLDEQGNLHWRSIAAPEIARELVDQAINSHGVTALILGNQTGHQPWLDYLRAGWPDLPLHLVDERHSSEAARLRYWDFYPLGWQRFLPVGLRLPPQPYDDLVAIILVERFLKAHTQIG